MAGNGTENQSGFEGPGALMGFELFESRVDPARVGREAARTRDRRCCTRRCCPAGVMPVAIGNGFGGVIFHEACGHGLEATSVAFGTSEFCGKLGQQIASPCVTAMDDGTHAERMGQRKRGRRGHAHHAAGAD